MECPILGKDIRDVGPLTRFDPGYLPDLFSLPLGGSIDSTSLLLIRKISGRMNISISFAFFVICELAWYYPYVIFILGENYGFGFV